MKYAKWIVIALLLALVAFSILKPKQEVTFSDEEYLKFKESASQKEVFEVINKNMVTGGPPKDGIPSIDSPTYITASEATLDPEELVFGLNYKGTVKAYPRSVMYWHEIVNEEIEGEQISITYCPLTGSVIGFKDKELGVSGKLYNSNLVMYDRASDSDVPQILQTAVNGPTSGEELTNIHVYVTTWQQWKEKHPTTLILSEDTGFDRDYTRSPYPGYEDALRVWFPLAAKSDEFKSKEWVTGVSLNGEHLAIHKAALKEKGEATYQLAGEQLNIVYDTELDVIKVFVKGEQLPSFDVYWFAWYAYHPDTAVFK